MKKLILSFVILVTGWSVNAQDEGLFWKVTNANGEASYLFGTYHLMGSKFVEEDRKEVLEAYNSSERVIVEMVLDSAKLPSLMSYYVMPGKSLKAMCSEEDYALIKEKIEPNLGAPLSAMDFMKPAVLSMTYTLALLEEATPDSSRREGMPIDLYFAEQAEQKGKAVIALETMEEQMEVLLNTESPEEQLEELLDQLKNEERSMADAKALVAAYVSDDLSMIKGLGDEYEDQTGNMDALVVKRNQNWIPKLSEVLDQGKSFVAVGALHLTGEDGLIELLRAEGYTLEAL